MNEITFQINSNPKNVAHAIVDEICNQGINCADVRWVHRSCVEPRCPISEWFTTNRDYNVTIGVRIVEE